MANYKNEHYVCACHQYEECTYDCHKFRLMERKPSNADKIRAMSDEELATFLFHAWNNASWCSAKDCPDEDSCLPCWLDWLRQECE